MKQKDHYRQILRLVTRVGRLTNPQHLPSLKRRRISLVQFLVLDALHESGQAMRMSELATDAGIGPSELTRAVTELESKGSVERGVDPRDSRARQVKLSRAGTRLIRQVYAEATDALAEVWEDFTHDEWHRLIDHLHRFERGLHRTRTGTT